MTTTLNKPAPYNILYGNGGWTDELDAATIEALVNIGAARLAKTTCGPGFETRVYVSLKGMEPQ